MSSSSGHQSAPPAVMNGAFGAIQRSIRALLAPSPPLYCECNQERLRQYCGQLAALDARLEELRRTAFAAATRLLSLDPPPQASCHAESSPAINGGRAP